MTLTLYLRNGWIRKHTSSRDEITRLLAIADRDIEQSQTAGLGPEWRFDIAYNAALQLATAALAANGYHAERQNKHMRTLECLGFAAKVDSDTVAFLDRCRTQASCRRLRPDRRHIRPRGRRDAHHSHPSASGRLQPGCRVSIQAFSTDGRLSGRFGDPEGEW